jgi:hypothetical protein
VRISCTARKIQAPKPFYYYRLVAEAEVYMSARAFSAITGLALVLASIMAPAQPDKQGADNLMARVSYQSVYTMSWSDQKAARICFALFRDGRYQLLKLSRGTREVLEGRLSQDELDSISTTLNSLDPEKSNKGGVIEKGSELLVAQLVRKGGTEYYAWINPDHQRPFPRAALRLVNWLQDFKPRDAAKLSLHEVSDFSICPPPSATPVPAAEIGTGAASSCGATGR